MVLILIKNDENKNKNEGKKKKTIKIKIFFNAWLITINCPLNSTDQNKKYYSR